MIKKKPTTRYESWMTNSILGGRHGRYISCIGMEQYCSSTLLYLHRTFCQDVAANRAGPGSQTRSHDCDRHSLDCKTEDMFRSRQELAGEMIQTAAQALPEVQLQVTSLWYHLCCHVPIRMVIVRDPAGKEKDDFFFCTDATVPDAEIVQRYYDRWGVESNFTQLEVFATS